MMMTVGSEGTLRLPCSDVEAVDMNCLNHGQCFVVMMLNDKRVPGCMYDYITIVS